MMTYIVYWMRMAKCALIGPPIYYFWLFLLFIGLVIGGNSYYHHLNEGLIVTNMNDFVSWGIGIANFVYFVGVAAGAVILVFPAYVLHREDIKEVVLIGEQLAVASILMCLLFIFADIGRPDRFWHLMPPFGLLNLPSSMLAWDVLVINGYLLLNLHIPGYALYAMYLKKKPIFFLYEPLVLMSILWAVSIHTVTAFLLAGLGSRYFWNTAIMAPRFLISAGASGPALLILIFSIINATKAYNIKESVFTYLKQVLRVTLPINMFLLACEIFKELYPNTIHAAPAQYLFFGLHGHTLLTKYIWTAIGMNTIATIIFLIPKLWDIKPVVYLGCIFVVVGIWIEKGMGLIFPGFIPSPLGAIVEYSPNWGELAVCIGVLSLGALLFTVTTKVALAIQSGRLSVESNNQMYTDFSSQIEPLSPGMFDYKIEKLPMEPFDTDK